MVCLTMTGRPQLRKIHQRETEELNAKKGQGPVCASFVGLAIVCICLKHHERTREVCVIDACMDG